MAKGGDRRCPCKSGRKYKRCCGPLHQGRPAPNPVALMRSRFAAYSLGLVDYIIDTTDPAGPMWQADGAAWRAELEDFCRRTRFRRLRVLASAVIESDKSDWVTGAPFLAGRDSVPPRIARDTRAPLPAPLDERRAPPAPSVPSTHLESGPERVSVRFVCVLEVGAESAETGENSYFTQVDGRWLYHSGQPG